MDNKTFYVKYHLYIWPALAKTRSTSLKVYLMRYKIGFHTYGNFYRGVKFDVFDTTTG
jgi:hypothetical protein